MKKWMVLLLCLLMVACNANNTTTEESVEKEALREKLMELTQIFDDSEITQTDIDQAISEAISLGLEGKGLVCSFLFNLSFCESGSRCGKNFRR